MTKVVKNEMVEKIRYIADDGAEFETEPQCRAHEEKSTAAMIEVKRNKLFSNAFNDEITEWLNGYGQWFLVTLEKKEDIIDFLEVLKSENYTDASYFDTSFVKEVCEVINRGDKFDMLIYWGDGYVTRYNYCFINEENYRNALKRLDDSLKLIEAMKTQMKYIPKEDESK